MFVPHASEIWTKSYGPNYTKFLSFLTKTNKQTNKQTKKQTNKNPGSLKSFLTKRWRYFGRRSCSGNDCLMLKSIDFKTTICQCSKNYISPTWVTRLKVAPNMADRVVLKTQSVALIEGFKKKKCVVVVTKSHNYAAQKQKKIEEVYEPSQFSNHYWLLENICIFCKCNANEWKQMKSKQENCYCL